MNSVGKTMPCFLCTADCPLSNSVAGGDTAVLNCPNCGKDMHLKKTKNKTLMIGSNSIELF